MPVNVKGRPWELSQGPWRLPGDGMLAQRKTSGDLRSVVSARSGDPRRTRLSWKDEPEYDGHIDEFTDADDMESEADG